MADVLIIADSVRDADLRHHVPVGIGDQFLYAETAGRKVVVTTSFELHKLPPLELGIEGLPYEEFGYDALVDRPGITKYELWSEYWTGVVQALRMTDVVVPANFPVARADALRKAGIEVRPDQEFFDDRRRVKNAAELAGIRRAQKAGEAGLRAGLELLRRASASGSGLTVDGQPLTCELIKEHVDRAFAEHGAAAEESIVSHGSQTAVGHDSGSGTVESGDVVLFDLFPRDRESACYADMTRTVVVGGEPSEEIREYHRLCKEALDRSIAMIRPGVNGRDVHVMVADFFHEHGQPTGMHKAPGEVLRDGFYHGLGHGVGLEVHEQPGLGRIGQPLVAGDVITLEPGLYRHGYAGVRLEDLILVTEDGCENLTDFPYDLEL